MGPSTSWEQRVMRGAVLYALLIGLVSFAVAALFTGTGRGLYLAAAGAWRSPRGASTSRGTTCARSTGT